MADSHDFRDWVAKAQGDRDSAAMLWAGFKPSLAFTITFHCQQAAEKYLKAALQMHGEPFPRTHDLNELLGLVERHVPALAQMRPQLSYLQPFAVNVRYPGFDPDRATCERAMQCLEDVRQSIRAALKWDSLLKD